ncbi:uncharacterized mitochondrial protein AtMg00860-like [Nicotiana tomentosiformis]|uniref:uncharacterized mitochondrial protein AtMg00860-like n=1 Tax=Nicotiana tomentosiformis TaxID=4098 RepID=UPI00388C9082
MVLAQKEIDFLGMHFVQGANSAGPHICQELLKFPYTSLTTKQIQQFLGVVNYVRDFIPNISTYISPLTEMLKKNAPSRGKKQDEAVREIKEISKNVKPIYIPSEEENMRICQRKVQRCRATLSLHLKGNSCSKKWNQEI